MLLLLQLLLLQWIILFMHRYASSLLILIYRLLPIQEIPIAGKGKLSEPATATAQIVLPPGWEQRTMPDGRVYYVDHNTRSTHWHYPSLWSISNSTSLISLYPSSVCDFPWNVMLVPSHPYPASLWRCAVDVVECEDYRRGFMLVRLWEGRTISRSA